MDNSDLDRVAAHELEGVLKELRDKNTKLTNEKKALEAKSSVAWVVISVALIVLFLAMCGTQSHHRHW